METTIELSTNKKTLQKIGISSLFIFSLSFLFFYTFYDFYKKHLKIPELTLKTLISIFISVLFVATALSVQKPKSLKEAYTYGGLVGLIIFGKFSLISFAFSPIPWDYSLLIFTKIYGMILGMLCSTLLWKIFY
jgi:hypothetical protein